MPKLHVHTAFTLRHDNGDLEKFGVGDHDFPVAVAAHWYVKHHTREPAVAVTPENDGAEDLAEREAALKEAAEFLNGMKADLDARAAELDQRTADLDARDTALVERENAHSARVAEFEAAQRAAAETAEKANANTSNVGNKKR